MKMIYGNCIIYYHITQIFPIFPITCGKFKCNMITNINQVMKQKYYFMTLNKIYMVNNQVIQVAKNCYHIT